MADVKEKHLWGHRPESEEDVCYKVLNNDGAKFIQGKWVSECLSSRGQLEEGGFYVLMIFCPGNVEGIQFSSAQSLSCVRLFETP